MNIAEILRKVADVIDHQSGSAMPDQTTPDATLNPNAGIPVDNPDNQDAGAEDDVMVPPLQLKVELLKRAVGVDNIYDQDGPRADQAQQPQQTQDPVGELTAILRNAGVPVAAIQELSNDEIVDD